MFVSAIETATKYTRSINTILRRYQSEEVEPGTATMFFVNDEGVAITCAHVAKNLFDSEMVNNNYIKFKEQESKLGSKHYKNNLRQLEFQFKYIRQQTPIQVKNIINGVDSFTNLDIIFHQKYDIAIIKFVGYKNICKDYAMFLKDSSQIKSGKFLCRLGYPFPEFSNFMYNREKDDIDWTEEGSHTPFFPLEGMVTRSFVNEGVCHGIEMSTSGLRGQSGGPLFDTNGVVYGMQSRTNFLDLGFEINQKVRLDDGKIKSAIEHSFLLPGYCIHLDIIKNFLKENNIKFFEI